MRGRRKHHGGVVSMEFVVAFATVLTLILGLLQVAHGYAARLMVTHAAERAARAAAVWVHEQRIGNATPTEVTERVNAAAALALAPISPPIGRTTGYGAKAPPYVEVAKAVGAREQVAAKAFDGWAAASALDADVAPESRALTKLAYAFHGTEVEVESSGGADQDRVRVTVHYAYYCPFPLANVLYGLTLGELGAAPTGESWAARLRQGGAPSAARVRIVKGTQEHFFSPLPEG